MTGWLSFQTCYRPSDYKYFSARYYEMNDQSFSFVKEFKISIFLLVRETRTRAVGGVNHA